MGNLNGVDITRGTVGPNTIGPATSPTAFLATGVAVSGKLDLGTVYKVNSVKDAEDNLGINAAYDTANNVVLHQHIVDFYSYPQSKNADLYLMVVATSSIPATVIEDTAAVAARKLIIAGGGAIKQFGFIFNLPAGYTETLVDGMNSHIRSAIAAGQALYDWAKGTERPCQVVLEGRGISSNLTSLLDLHNIPVNAAVLKAHKVSIVIAQDWDYADARSNAFCKKYAAVGKLLGAVAGADVSQSIGEVSVFNLSDATTGSWVTAGLSNHLKVDDQESYLTVLKNKGYIFAGTYTGVTGLRFSHDDTCTPIEIDVLENMSEHTIYYGRTMDYAELMLKRTLMPLVRSRISVDATTGKLPTAVIKDIERSCNLAVFEKMKNEALCSGGKTIIDKNSPVMPPDNRMDCEFHLVPMAILGEISGEIYLRRKL